MSQLKQDLLNSLFQGERVKDLRSIDIEVPEYNTS